MMTIGVRFAVGLMFLMQAVASEIVMHRKSPGLVDDKLVIPKVDFTQAKLEARFRKTLSDLDRSVRLLHLEVFIDRREAVSGNIKLRSDVNYDVWKNLYQEYRQKVPPSAELLMINENAAMRIRSRDGKVTTTVLRGTNPFILQIPGAEFHLVYLVGRYETSWKGLKSKSLEKTQAVRYYLVSSQSIDLGLAKSITEQLRKQTGFGDVYVDVRPDPWFITDSDYPVVPPYVERSVPPTETQFRETPTVSCVADDQEIECFH